MAITLPSVQLDSIVEDSAFYVIANRNPQPGEVQIPPTSKIEFDYFGTDEITITVNEVPVFQQNAVPQQWQNGWQGTNNVLPGNVGVRYILQSPTPFANNSRVFVRVFAVGLLIGFWEFDVYDTMPPLIRSVVAINKDQLRVTFSEPVTMVSPDVDGDALNPRTYTVEHVSRPAAIPDVVLVEPVSSSVVLLTTKFELSFGAHYMLVVAGITDEFGNVFKPPQNVFEFYGWLPPFPNGRRWVLHDFVPRMSLIEDKSDSLKLFLGVLQDTNNLLLYSIDQWADSLDPDTAPMDAIDAMLVDLGNPFTFEMSDVQKRKLVKTLVLMYQLKGTAPGIERVVRFFLGIEVSIETFVGRGWRLGYHQLSRRGQPASNPAIIGPHRRALYSFRVLTSRILTDIQRAIITAIAQYMRCAHEHLVGIRDGSPVLPPGKYWIIGKTRIGFSRIYKASPGSPVYSPHSAIINSFTLA